MLRPGGWSSGKSRTITFLTVSVLLTFAAAAHAQLNNLTITSPANGATVTSLPITVSGTQSPTATAVVLDVIQDPTANVPPTGTGGATNTVNPQLTSSTAWQTSLSLLNGTYRLTASSDADFPPASIDITVNVPNNPGFLDCLTDPGGQGVQAPVVGWDPGGATAPFVNFNFSRSASAGVPELDADPTNYPVGTAFTCTQDTNGRVPRMLIIGGEPVIDAASSFVGWSYDAATETLTARMETVEASLPDGTVLNSTIAALFAMYDDDTPSSGILPDMTGTYLAANASFSFGWDFDGTTITGFSLTLDGPADASAFFKAFFPNNAVTTFFGSSCADIPLPEISPASSLVSGPTVSASPPAPATQLGCELSVEVKFPAAAAPLTRAGISSAQVEVKQSLEAEPAGPLSIDATTLSDGEVGVSYNDDLEISGGVSPYTVTVTPALPPGLNVDSNGVITGSPTGKGASFTAQVTDNAGTKVSKKFKVAVFKLLSITTNALKAGKVGKKYSGGLKVTGGKKPYTWSITSGSLPAGLTLDTATGKITGTPTTAGSSNLTFRVTDPAGGEDEQTLTLTIN